MNQSNNNAYTRIYSCAKTITGPYFRLNVSGGNPNMLIFIRSVYSFTQTNYPSGDFHGANVKVSSVNFDTNGDGGWRTSNGYWSGSGIDFGFDVSNRQAIVWIFNNGTSFPGKASVVSHITCNRWDYLTLTQL